MFKHANKKSKTEAIELDINEAIDIKERLKKISAGDIITKKDEKFFHMASQLIGTLISIYGMWSSSKKKINRLLKIIFGNRSEKLKDLGGGSTSSNNGDDKSGKNDKDDSNIDNPSEKNSSNKDSNGDEEDDDGKKRKKKKKKKKRIGGGGKNSADDYESAAEITCKLDHDKQPGAICPECKKNKLYEVEPKKVIRLIGNAPITAFEFILQQVRCICGALFTADVGDEFRDIYNEDKYGPSALAAMIIYKNLMGVSFGTLSAIQGMNGIPLPVSTQANQIKNKALPTIKSIFDELKKLASNANALGFDDTVIKTIEKSLNKKGNETNRGHGTAIIANDFDNDNNNEIVLFDFAPSKHAGDVVCDLLLLRERESLPLLISDGLASYDKCKENGVDVNCNAHARRKVVEEDPERKSYVGQAVLDCFGSIYKNDKDCKENNLSEIERMVHHKEFSTFYFEKIRAIFNIVSGVEDDAIIRKKYTIPEYLSEDEPNGDLRSIADYFLNRYTSLTVVTKIPGVPLDTNYVERMIKVVIRIRKNSLFFNNAFSASYSGEILSLLETAVQNNVNVFDYVKFLLENKKDVMKKPKNYLPWLYLWDDIKKDEYWRKNEELIKSPSNFSESSTDESCHSSA